MTAIHLAKFGDRDGISLVRRYLRPIRPVRGRIYQEVHYQPGEALQVDWGDCTRVLVGQTPRRVSVLVATLCFSRYGYIEFSLSQTKADFYRAVVHALEFFQGSPRKIIVDNLRAAVLNGAGRHACWHPEFLALCGHYCLEPIACARRDPESKDCAARYTSFLSFDLRVPGRRGSDRFRPWHFTGLSGPNAS